QVHQFFAARPDALGSGVASPQWALREALRGLSLGVGGWAALLAALLLFAAGLWRYWRQGRVTVAMFLLPGVLTAAAALAMHPPIFPRFFFFLVGFGLLILVRGATALGDWLAGIRFFGGPRRGWGAGLGTAAVLAGVAASLAVLVRGGGGPKQDYERAMRFV